MNKKNKNVLWFYEVTKEDIPLVGGKGANLGELTNAGIPVPPGFIVTAHAYYEFLSANALTGKIKRLLKNVNPDDNKALNKAAHEIKKSIMEGAVPQGIKNEIQKSYKKLCYDEGDGNVFVAVRSSATAEDLPQASFAGQQETYLNMMGATQVVEAVQKCWASLFDARAIYYRVVNKFDHLKVGIATPVQLMVQSEKSGIMFTADPVLSDTKTIVIDAGFGLGEAIVSGSVNPDRYKVRKDDFEIIDKTISRQIWEITKVNGRNKHVAIAKENQTEQKITDSEIVELAKIGARIEEHYGKPQDTEWAINSDGKIYFVQSRPITTLTKKVKIVDLDREKPTIKAKILVKGLGASIGVASGPVKLIHKPEEINKVNVGDVLVTEMTNPSFVPAMKKAKAIVTDTGGVTSHAAIVSREMGIPCIVGSGVATHTLKTGQIVTVDAVEGVVYQGKIKLTHKDKKATLTTRESVQKREKAPKTSTKVYVNLAEPELAENISKQPVDGVGLLRAEFIIAALGKHPRDLVNKGQGEKYVHALSAGIKKIAQAFYPRPVVYRATDFKSNEYKALAGGAKYEPQEENPMIGYRGCFRYIKEPDLFKLELKALKLLREKHGLTNIWLMLPFVRTIKELQEVKAILKEADMERSQNFKLWMMAEIPSNVILIDDFIAEGIDGVSIGTNDLTQLTLGVDRDNELLAEEFDERNEAVTRSVKKLVKSCHDHGVTCSVCGQAPSIYPEFTEMLVENGVTSVSVNPDVIISTRKLVASVEKKIYLSDKK